MSSDKNEKSHSSSLPTHAKDDVQNLFLKFTPLGCSIVVLIGACVATWVILSLASLGVVGYVAAFVVVMGLILANVWQWINAK